VSPCSLDSSIGYDDMLTAEVTPDKLPSFDDWCVHLFLCADDVRVVDIHSADGRVKDAEHTNDGTA